MDLNIKSDEIFLHIPKVFDEDLWLRSHQVVVHIELCIKFGGHLSDVVEVQLAHAPRIFETLLETELGLDIFDEIVYIRIVLCLSISYYWIFVRSSFLFFLCLSNHQLWCGWLL